MTRDEARARVREAELRFKGRLGEIPALGAWTREELATAVRLLANDLEALDVGKSVAYRELAELVELVPPRERRRDLARNDPPSACELGPDLEGDEYLLERTNRFRRP